MIPDPIKNSSPAASPSRPKGDRARSAPGQWLAGPVVGLALSALIVPAVAKPNLRLVWNVSASVPLGLYRIEPGHYPKVGELAAVRPAPTLARLMADRRYVEQGALLVKPVAAVTGARVCRQQQRITINVS